MCLNEKETYEYKRISSTTKKRTNYEEKYHCKNWYFQ